MNEKIIIKKHDNEIAVKVEASATNVIFMLGKALDNVSSTIEERLGIPKEAAVKAVCEFALSDKNKQSEIASIAEMINILYSAGDKEALSELNNILNMFGDDKNEAN